jgi:hypothetical protein
MSPPRNMQDVMDDPIHAICYVKFKILFFWGHFKNN